MAYDKALAVYTPDGRLMQVERAQQASEQGTLVVFSTSPTHTLLAIEKRNTNKLMIDDDDAKLILICPLLNIYMSFAGLSPDSYIIRNQARLIVRNYKLKNGENITLKRLAYELSEIKHKYTIVGGKRPFGIRTLLFGLQNDGNGMHARVYIVEPDGNFSEYFKGAIGNRSESVVKYLEENEGDALDGIFQAVQNDVSKICCFKIGYGVEQVSTELVKEYINGLYEKQIKGEN